jgi:hypothetical protein
MKQLILFIFNNLINTNLGLCFALKTNITYIFIGKYILAIITKFTLS